MSVPLELRNLQASVIQSRCLVQLVLSEKSLKEESQMTVLFVLQEDIVMLAGWQSLRHALPVFIAP